jgi:hypothetical protein
MPTARSPSARATLGRGYGSETGSFGRLSDRCGLHGLVSKRSNREPRAAPVSQYLLYHLALTVTVFGALVLLALLRTGTTGCLSPY